MFSKAPRTTCASRAVAGLDDRSASLHRGYGGEPIARPASRTDPKLTGRLLLACPVRYLLTDWRRPVIDDALKVFFVDAPTPGGQADHRQLAGSDESIDRVDGAVEPLRNGRQLDQPTLGLCGALRCAGHECNFRIRRRHRDTA